MTFESNSQIAETIFDDIVVKFVSEDVNLDDLLVSSVKVAKQWDKGFQL